ncbi:hypothetical protein [Nocardioides terrae]|uniref:hypothetical protein n=1 Tax=Nocardioides terrae TaxID=574651 RepID=UPI0011145259|nr:hypothetical protein [Nocardioides terrae]
MSGHRGKRAAQTQQRAPRSAVLVHALGITLAVAAWGYLVWAAIDFGSSARDGDSRSWWFLGLAGVGAVACLFVGLMLVARLVRTLGMAPEAEPTPAPRSPGGKRAAR